MWFAYALAALFAQVSRRSAEKKATGHINSLALSWLQQTAAMPFIILTLFFAKFYWPSQLSGRYWQLLLLYAVLISLDTYLYFKSLSLADVSYVAPLLSLVALGNIAGAYIVLGQKPTYLGMTGAALIVTGAIFTYRGKRNDLSNGHANKLALLLILLLVIVRGFNSNIEVLMLRLSNPTTFNFYSSVLSIPLIILASILIITTRQNDSHRAYWTKIRLDVTKHRSLLAFIGLTYTISMLATYEAKLIGPNAGYVGAIKTASVLPMMLFGVIFFKEKIVGLQWAGLAIIAGGLVCLGLG